MDILIKASNGASDFGNKFGQPLITGSVLTFEHEENNRKIGYDKVIMQAGGIGYGKLNQAIKHKPQEGDKIVILGGENYRIGMGGAAVSSADTGAFGSGIELNAIQRSNPEMQKRAANAIRGLVESDNNPIVSIHDHGAGGHLNCLSELVEETGGLIDLDKLPVGDPTLSATSTATLDLGLLTFDIEKYRDIWFKTSFLLDQKQSKNGTAQARFDNYKNQVLNYIFPTHFTGKKPEIDNSKPRPKAAIIREKGSNSEREMANAMYLAGFDVKDVHMTDLISGRETLEDIQFIGAVGGFSNSDVLGSAKGWAGAFKYNEKANTALINFFKREDTLSVGICNGCQLFMELEVINPEHKVHGKMLHNDSHKHESIFTSVTIQENKSVMLSTLAGSTLGVWVSHGEGKFNLPEPEANYNIVGKYGYDSYPANPNGSDFNTAMLCDTTGRHLVMMPHIERSTFQWNWANYPKDRNDEVTPWHEAFVNARKWIEKI